MINKLKRKFVVVNMMIVTVMLAVIFGLVLFFTKSNMELAGVQMLRNISMKPMQFFREGMPDRLPPLVFAVFRTQENEYAAVGSDVLDLSDKELIKEIYDSAVQSGTETGVLEQYDLRFQLSRDPAKIPDPMKSTVYFADISAEKETLRQLSYTCIVIAVISFGVFLIISILLAKWTVRPVENAWEQQKQFVADASHELKTPLTVIMTNAEMLTESSHSDEKRKQFSENILVMSKQMKGLIEGLLELARSDSNTRKTITESVDLSRLINDAVLPFEPLYFEKGLTLECEIEDNMTVIGDSAQLLRLADILLDNAMKYSYPQTTVSVGLKKQRDNAVFFVRSHGDEISKQDLKNIFKRFYRVNKARSMDHSYGLGLSIAESIVSAHGGRIRAKSSGGVNEFYVRLHIE